MEAGRNSLASGFAAGLVVLASLGFYALDCRISFHADIEALHCLRGLLLPWIILAQSGRKPHRLLLVRFVWFPPHAGDWLATAFRRLGADTAIFLYVSLSANEGGQPGLSQKNFEQSHIFDPFLSERPCWSLAVAAAFNASIHLVFA